MLETFYLNQTFRDLQEALFFYQDFLRKIDSTSKQTSAVVSTNNSYFDTSTIESQQTVLMGTQIEKCSDIYDDLMQKKMHFVVQSKNKITSNDFVFQAELGRAKIIYPLEDSLTFAHQYIMPWLDTHAPLFHISKQTLQKEVLSWLNGFEKFNASPLDLSKIRTPIFSKSKPLCFVYSLEQSTVGRHKIISNWVIEHEGFDLLRLWGEMNKKKGNDHFVWIIHDDFSDFETSLELIEHVYTLRPCNIDHLVDQLDPLTWVHIDLHTDGNLAETPIQYSFLTKKNHLDEYEYRLILDSSEQDIDLHSVYQNILGKA